jgi:hypothetical protein
MEINRFSDNNLRLMMLIYKKGFMTVVTQNLYGGMGFFDAKMFLLKRGMIRNDGTDDKKRKIWVLTDRGKKFIKAIDELEKLILEGMEESKGAKNGI